MGVLWRRDVILCSVSLQLLYLPPFLNTLTPALATVIMVLCRAKTSAVIRTATMTMLSATRPAFAAPCIAHSGKYKAFVAPQPCWPNRARSFGL